MWPQAAHRRKCTHQPPTASHSAQPVPLGGTDGSTAAVIAILSFLADGIGTATDWGCHQRLTPSGLCPRACIEGIRERSLVEQAGFLAALRIATVLIRLSRNTVQLRAEWWRWSSVEVEAIARDVRVLPAISAFCV
jgi:hypothetical protein